MAQVSVNHGTQGLVARHRGRPRRRGRHSAPAGGNAVAWLRGLLWLTVGIYLGMAWMGSPHALRVEFLGGLPVAALALTSVEWPWLLVAGWALHPVWDLLHHRNAVQTRIHPVIVPFCLVFDLLVAGVAAFVTA